MLFILHTVFTDVGRLLIRQEIKDVMFYLDFPASKRI